MAIPASRFVPLAAVALLLAACETSFDARLSADPVDEATRVNLPLEGLALRTRDGQIHSLRLDRAARVDLTVFDLDSPYELIVNHRIDEGDYEAVQLLLDTEDAELQRPDGGVVSVEISGAAPFVPLAFSIDEDGGATVELSLDLRLSLSEQDDGRYRLRPVMRAVLAGDGAVVRGEVSPLLLTDAACARGAAVYLFEGRDIEPDERDGRGVEPYATGRVDTQFAPALYRIGVLPAGDYTLALTCDGEFEDGLNAADPPLRFLARETLTLLRGETRVLSLLP